MRSLTWLRRVLPAVGAAALLGLGGDTPSHATPPGAKASQHIMTTPNELDWKPGPAALPPGSRMAVIEGDPAAEGKLFTFRVRFPAGYRIAPHTHPADEHITVVAGEFLMGLGEKFDASKAKALPAGSFAVMPVGERHYAFTRQPTELQVHAIGPWGITYVNPKDDPRNAATGGAGMPKKP